MPITRQQATAVYEHMMLEFLRVPMDSPIGLALSRNEINNLLDVVSLTFDDVDSLTYIPATVEGQPGAGPMPLMLGHRNMLKVFLKWHEYLVGQNSGQSLSINQWLALTGSNFELEIPLLR